MSKRLLAAAAAAASLVGTAAAASSHPGGRGPALPDFPQDAQPGACYARIPAGGSVGVHAGAGPAVWTVRRGAGPTAVWEYSHGGAPGVAAASGSLAWAQVDCGSGQPIRSAAYAQVELTPPPSPSPPPPLQHDLGPYADTAPPAAGPTRRVFRIQRLPGGHPSPEHASPPPQQDLGPYADAGPMGALQPPPMPGFDAGRAPFGPAPLPPRFEPRSPGPPPAAPWFGGRMLSWPGKTPR